MFARRRLLATTAATIFLALAGTASAQAATFYVSTAGNDANACTSPSAACRTINKAIEDARLSPGSATIQVGSGTFTEDVHVESSLDAGLRIIGGGPGTTRIAGTPGAEPAFTQAPGISTTLADLTVEHTSADTGPAIGFGGNLSLVQVNVKAEGKGAESAITTQLEGPPSFGSLTMIGGRIVLGAAATGPAIYAIGTAKIKGAFIETKAEEAVGVDLVLGGRVEGSTIIGRGKNAVDVGNYTPAGPPLAGAGTVHLIADRLETTAQRAAGALTYFGSLDIKRSHFVVRGAEGYGAAAFGGRLNVEASSATVEANGFAFGGELATSIHLSNDRVVLNAPTDTQPAVETAGYGPVEIARTSISGNWAGPGLLLTASKVRLYDDQVRLPASSSAAPARVLALGDTGTGLWMQRTTLRAGNKSDAALLLEPVAGTSVIDSSLLGGGATSIGIFSPNTAGKTSQTTIVGSTLDPGTPGVTGEAGVHSITVQVAGAKRRASVHVVGSVLFAPIEAALTEGAREAAVGCSYSEAPTQQRVGSSTLGAISCRSGVHGNHNFSSPSSIFASPFSAYSLRAHTRAIDSVPLSALGLPSGLTASKLDLAGRPRTVDARIGSRCVAVMDRGAKQLKGQKSTCKHR